ncbi:hypothetical protein MANES_15G178248v8 [Manihot esculenta]|uniref:Uncharacterized protein n=1 Tax=Manihot esculenta TaxID=3983 RepID=A0ACB7GE49_MANES|nr:hypothetical protein MANES_15G178248v8 [Manihot esculenta]
MIVQLSQISSIKKILPTDVASSLGLCFSLCQESSDFGFYADGLAIWLALVQVFLYRWLWRLFFIIAAFLWIFGLSWCFSGSTCSFAAVLSFCLHCHATSCLFSIYSLVR